MASAKQVTLYGLTGVPETTYNSGTPAPAVTDGIMLAEPAVGEISYIHEGIRGNSPGAGGQLGRVAPSGRMMEFTAEIEGRGGGTAYATAVYPQDLHLYLMMAGHEATVDETTGSESWTYAPESGPTGFSSGHLYAYGRGEEYRAQGAYADMAFTLDSGFLQFSFLTRATCAALPTDVSLPAITYQSLTTKPPKASGLTLDINAVTTLVCRTLSFELNRTIEPRADINAAAALQGFTPGRRDPRMTVVIEATPLATLDPYTLRDTGVEMNLSWTIGSTQYNQITFVAPNAQIVSISQDDDGPTATWAIEFVLAMSTPTGDDGYSLLFD